MKRALLLPSVLLAAILSPSCVPYSEGDVPPTPNADVAQNRPAPDDTPESREQARRERQAAREREQREENRREAREESNSREKKPEITEKVPDPEPPAPEPKPRAQVARVVPGKPGFVFSPYNNKIIDVKGIPSGTLVQDPTYPQSEKKYFRVP